MYVLTTVYTGTWYGVRVVVHVFTTLLLLLANKSMLLACLVERKCSLSDGIAVVVETSTVTQESQPATHPKMDGIGLSGGTLVGRRAVIPSITIPRRPCHCRHYYYGAFSGCVLATRCVRHSNRVAVTTPLPYRWANEWEEYPRRRGRARVARD